MAERVCHLLRAQGYKPWLAPVDLLGGQQWHDEIGRQIRKCNWFLVLVTPSSVRSKWVRREVVYALQLQHLDDRLIPVIAKPAKIDRLSWVLHSLQHVTLDLAVSSAGSTSLLSALKKG